MAARQLSAADIDHPATLPRNIQDEMAAPLDGGDIAGPRVWTTDGWQPYVAEEVNPPTSPEETPLNPWNPKGQPSLSLPQQTTPLTSEQGVISNEDLADRERLDALMVEDGLTPDNPYNPKGTPDYITSPHTDPLEEPPPPQPN